MRCVSGLRTGSAAPPRRRRRAAAPGRRRRRRRALRRRGGSWSSCAGTGRPAWGRVPRTASRAACARAQSRPTSAISACHCSNFVVELRRLGHLLGRAAGELHRDRLLDRVPDRLLQRLAGLADRRLAGDHLGHGQPGAVALDDPPERHVGDARHRRQDDRRFDADGTDLDGLRGGPWDARDRVECAGGQVWARLGRRAWTTDDVALLVAAGSGSRAGGELPKQYRRIAGKALLAHAIDHLRHPADRRRPGGDRRGPGGALSRGGRRPRPPLPGHRRRDAAAVGRATASRRSRRRRRRARADPRRRPPLPARARSSTGCSTRSRRHDGAVPALPVVDTLARPTARSASRCARDGAGPGADPAGLPLRRDPRRPRAPGPAARRPTTPRSPAPPGSRSPSSHGDPALEKLTYEADFAPRRGAPRRRLTAHRHRLRRPRLRRRATSSGSAASASRTTRASPAIATPTSCSTRSPTRCSARSAPAISATISRRRDPQWRGAALVALPRACPRPGRARPAAGSTMSTSRSSARRRGSARIGTRCAARIAALVAAAARRGLASRRRRPSGSASPAAAKASPPRRSRRQAAGGRYDAETVLIAALLAASAPGQPAAPRLHHRRPRSATSPWSRLPSMVEGRAQRLPPASARRRLPAAPAAPSVRRPAARRGQRRLAPALAASPAAIGRMTRR